MAVVKAPLVVAKGEGGDTLYLYAGAEVPTLAEGELERLADYFESAEESEKASAGKRGNSK